MPEVRLTGPARRDLDAILKHSRKDFGEAAALRYQSLIVRALRDIGDDPLRPGSKERPEILIAGARTYHIQFSRSEAEGAAVKAPRHFLVYRRAGNDVIEVGRILHDSRDLPCHFPNAYRRPQE